MGHPGRVEGVLLPGVVALCCNDDAQDLFQEVSITYFESDLCVVLEILLLAIELFSRQGEDEERVTRKIPWT